MDAIDSIEAFATYIANTKSPTDARRAAEQVFIVCAGRVRLPDSLKYWQLINFLLGQEACPGYSLVHHRFVHDALANICGPDYDHELKWPDVVDPRYNNFIPSELGPFAFTVLTRMLQIVVDNFCTSDPRIGILANELFYHTSQLGVDTIELCDDYARVLVQYGPKWGPWDSENVPKLMMGRVYFHGDERLRKDIEKYFDGAQDVDFWQHTKPLVGYAERRLFTLIVAVTDGYFSADLGTDEHRFFRIAGRLPIELQARIARSPTSNLRATDIWWLDQSH